MDIFVILDSSYEELNVGLLCEGKLIEESSFEAWQRQSELLIPELDKLLTKENLAKDDIKGVITTVGPGSYTGVRISLTTAKVMSMALNVPIYEVSSLHALADFERVSITLMNARSNRSYVGIFDKEKVLLADCVLSNEEVIKIINDNPSYKVMGNTEYLGIVGEKPHVLKEIASLFPYLKASENPLAVKPIYLKETYESKFNS